MARVEDIVVGEYYYFLADSYKETVVVGQCKAIDGERAIMEYREGIFGLKRLQAIKVYSIYGVVTHKDKPRFLHKLTKYLQNLIKAVLNQPT